MASTLIDSTPCFLRHRALGTEAVYEVLSESDGIVTAAVISAPGLESGTHVRLLSRAARGMDRLDVAAAQHAATRRFSPSGAGFAGPIAAR